MCGWDGYGDGVRGFGFVRGDLDGPGFGEVERGVRVECDFGDECVVGALQWHFAEVLKVRCYGWDVV